MNQKSNFLGEFIGTFLMVLFGTAVVCSSIVFDGVITSVFQIGIIWALIISISIYLTRNLSNAHFNPAVTVAMIVTKRMKLKELPSYLLGQFAGAFCGSLVLYLIYHHAINSFEAKEGIIRGSKESMKTAKMFGEFYINMGSPMQSMLLACLAEGIGTFLLIFFIFSLTEGANVGRPDNNLAPLFIGLCVGLILCIIAPITQAGLNPARDFAPRLAAHILGWGYGAYPDALGGFFFVYILSPLIGAVLAGMFFTKIVEPLMKKN